MRQKSETPSTSSEQVVKDIRRATRKHHSAEEKIRIVLDGLPEALVGIHTPRPSCRKGQESTPKPRALMRDRLRGQRQSLQITSRCANL
jgi:hypothetical protein